MKASVKTLDCDGKPLTVDDKVSARPNHDGVAVGIPGKVTGFVRGKVRVEFLVEGFPSVRVVGGNVLRKSS